MNRVAAVLTLAALRHTMTNLIRALCDRWQRWRERRNPALLVRRLYAEGVIDDEMLRHANAEHVVHGGRRRDTRPAQASHESQIEIVDGFVYAHVYGSAELVRYTYRGQPITSGDWFKHQWTEVTTLRTDPKVREWEDRDRARDEL